MDWMVYYIFDLFNMDVMVTDPTVCSGLFSSEAAGAQMSGLWFGVNVALESPAAWRLMILYERAHWLIWGHYTQLNFIII